MNAASIWLVGCGNMGAAMLHRWLAAGVAPDTITVIDPGVVDLPPGIRRYDGADDLDWTPDIVVLAVKPQQMTMVAPQLRAAMPRPPGVLISILAGVEAHSLARMIGATLTVRAMPNLPVAIGQGVVALYSDDGDAAGRARAEALMTPLGHVEWVTDEGLFDAITALSGSGPGFTFRYIDALAQAGVAIGLPAALAARLALATVGGSAAMAVAADEPPAILAERVASKGGSTREGLNVLDADEALVRLLTDTLAAAQRRNGELADAARYS